MRMPLKGKLRGLSASLAFCWMAAACSSVPSQQGESAPSPAQLAVASPNSAPVTKETRGNDKKESPTPQAAPIAPVTAPADLIVFFSPGKATLSEEAISRVKELAEQLKSDRDQDAELTAKANYMGSRSLCLALSANRLNAVVSKLLQLGVRNDQLRQKNMGCENLKLANAACQTPQCGAPNERIEIRLTR